MINTRTEFGSIVRIMRKKENITQDNLAKKLKTNRSVIAHLEQGLRLPAPDVLERICKYFGIDKNEWEHFADEHSATCVLFEQTLEEITGRTLSLHHIDKESRKEAEKNISNLFIKNLSEFQKLDLLNRILISYGVRKITREFYNVFLKNSLTSPDEFERAVEKYQKIAIRLFSTFFEAFVVLNSEESIEGFMNSIKPREMDEFKERDEWAGTNAIEESKLDYLGYIAAEKIKQSDKERAYLQKELNGIAKGIEEKSITYIHEINEKKKSKIDTLLRQFDTTFEHGLFSTLFAPDPDEIRREAIRIGPKKEGELAVISQIQHRAMANLSNYLTADYLDVYVATSMRSSGDFVSVNRFIKALFERPKVKGLKLRYFNPTQSWIEDRVSKGLVEALMLKRAEVTIYMAQKTDTFGKDSEASVALGQGKPVIVFVPKLLYQDIDSEKLGILTQSKLMKECKDLGIKDLDETADEQVLMSHIVFSKINKLSCEDLCDLIRNIWDDFDLYSESSRVNERLRKAYRKWLDEVIDSSKKVKINEELRNDVESILVAITINFEKRAKVFKEIHPLALQVILSSGVLNGILVVRSVKQCGEVLVGLLSNNLEYSLKKDDDNYRLIEKDTGSTIRVISRNKLIKNAFGTFYRRNNIGKTN